LFLFVAFAVAVAVAVDAMFADFVVAAAAARTGQSFRTKRQNFFPTSRRERFHHLDQIAIAVVDDVVDDDVVNDDVVNDALLVINFIVIERCRPILNSGISTSSF